MHTKLFKVFINLLIFTMCIFLTGCHNSPVTNSTSNINLSETDLVAGYLSAIDLVFNTSPEMNQDIKYLAIDTKALTNLNQEDCIKLLEELKTYHFEIIDASFEDLQNQGYINDAVFENGLFLKIEDTPFSNNQIQIMPSKWHSTTYAAGLSKVILTLNDEQNWNISDVGIPWKQ
ncbi:hypothetical protein [Cellulosilyticum ruminicola]|uniref:hypothetical protein n=1 Tax=Cellulosilyticum ruminicola TaxID=425254 RepID=UPI0006D104E0|nr:hypothetical protein [Cellulosilyticum ruminicola]